MLQSSKRVEIVNDVLKFLITRAHKPATAVRKEETEPESEKDFVRSFGAKVKRVRLSGRTDYIGLLVMGSSTGFLVHRVDGKRCMTKTVAVGDRLVHSERAIILEQRDSMAQLHKGLLNWVK